MLLTTSAVAEGIPVSGPGIVPKGAAGLCSKYAWLCSNESGKDLSYEQVERVNRSINRIKPVSDMQLYGVAEKWTLPTSRGGDCEDYVLAKKKALVELGADPRKILVTTALDTEGNSHAVLVWKTAKGDFILDNLTNKIRLWDETGYFYMLMQDPKDLKKWVRVFKSS